VPVATLNLKPLPLLSVSGILIGAFGSGASFSKQV
jgi:hypothetical protein